MLECCLQINLAAKITWIESFTCSSIIISFDKSAVKRVKKDSSCDTYIHVYATTEGPRGKSTELFESSCCATQRKTKWQAPERKAKKYSPATIRDEAHIAVSEILGRLCFNTAAFCGCQHGTERQPQAAIFKTDGRPTQWQQEF